jgi:hypothetical protein
MKLDPSEEGGRDRNGTSGKQMTPTICQAVTTENELTNATFGLPVLCLRTPCALLPN